VILPVHVSRFSARNNLFADLQYKPDLSRAVIEWGDTRWQRDTAWAMVVDAVHELLERLRGGAGGGCRGIEAAERERVAKVAAEAKAREEAAERERAAKAAADAEARADAAERERAAKAAAEAKARAQAAERERAAKAAAEAQGPG
jgi:colicin import membrane protein